LHGLSCAFIPAAIFDKFVQKLTMYIQIADRCGCASHFFQRVEPLACRLLQSIVCAVLAQDGFNYGLQAARTRTHVVYRVNIRVDGALFQIAAQSRCELAQMFLMQVWLARCYSGWSGLGHYAVILNL
jgi:hypothetical protein